MTLPPSSARRRRPWVWAAAALLALLAVAWLALAIAFPPERVRALVQAQLGTVLARDVRYTDARIVLLPPVRLTVEGLTLAEPGGFTRGRALEAASLHFDLDPWALLTSRRVVVRRLVLDRPQLHVLLRENGSTNLDSLVRPGRSQAKPMDFEVRELSIRDGRVLIDDLRARRRVAFAVGSRIAMASRGQGARYSTSGETALSRLAFGPLSAARLADLDTSYARLRWRLAHRGAFDAQKQRLALERLALAFGRTELVFQGLVDEPGPRARLDLTGRGSGIDVGDILGFLSAADVGGLEGIRASGKLDFDLRARGALGGARPPAITGVARVADASFRYPGATAGVEGLAFTARFAPDSLGIADLRGRVSGQPLRGRIAVTHFQDPRVFFQVEGDIDLAAVAPLFAPKDTRLGGRAAVNLSGTGRAKDPGGFQLDGRARLAGVTLQRPDLPSRIEQIQGDVRFTPARASVSGFTAKAGKSSFVLDGTVTRPLALLAKPGSVAPSHVDFTMRSPYLDLAELLPTTPGAPLTPNATGGGRVEIARLRDKKLDVRDVSARVALEPGIVAAPEFALTGYQGRVVGNARFDLRNPAAPAFAVKAQADSVEANALLSAWTPAKDLIHGVLNLEADLSGRGLEPGELAKTLTAAGVAAIGNGTLGPGPVLEGIASFVKIPAFKQLKIRDGTFPFYVENGRVLFRDVKLRGPTGDWRLAGSTGFDGSLDYAVSISLLPEIASRFGAAPGMLTGPLRALDGSMLLDLRVRGTAKKPVVMWDAKATRDRLAGRVSGTIEDQKRELEEQVRDAARARQKAAEDSARAVAAKARKAVEDSLRARAGNVLEKFFGGLGGRRDTVRRDTTRRDSS